MKPLKGQVHIYVAYDSTIYWEIHIPGRIKISTVDTYATEKGAERSARLWAKKLGIELL